MGEVVVPAHDVQRLMQVADKMDDHVNRDFRGDDRRPAFQHLDRIVDLMHHVVRP